MVRRFGDDEDFLTETGGRFFTSEVEELPDSDMPVGGVTELSDGGLAVEMPELAGNEDLIREAEMTARMSAFEANLAELMDDAEREQLGVRLKEYVTTDMTTRLDWERRMAKGLELIGIQDIPEDAVAFKGAAQANYPGLAEAMVQFQARAMEEMMPAEGPVKGHVIGKPTAVTEAQAQRVQDFMNWQLMEQDDEYYEEADQSFLALPYYGSFFKIVAPDPFTNINRSRYVSPIDFIVPYWATSLQTAPRYTHRYTMGINAFKRAVASGYFVDTEFEPGMQNEQTQARVIADAADEKTSAYHPDDKELWFYEMTIEDDFTEFDDPLVPSDLGYSAPYVITFEWETGRVVRVVRAWDREDPSFKKEVWAVHYKFLPSLGFYGWGYLHVIGGLGRAASGALRLLLDGSATSSLQGGFKSKDSRLSSDIQFEPGVWKDVDMAAEELAKSFYSPPFKEPSPALFKTLEILINVFQRFASTTDAVVGDAKNTGPVGTTVALIEQGSKLLSGIHKRCHAAQRREFKLLALANFRYLPPEFSYPFATDERGASVKADFDPKVVDVIPVSDPNIFSSVQRIALAQAVCQAVDMRPDLFPAGGPAARKAYRALFKALRVPDAEDYLPERPAIRMDPVSENVALLHGSPIQSFREQDHGAHLAVHQAFLAEVQGMEPEIATKATPVLMAHIAEHYAHAYRQRAEAAVVQATGGVPLPPYDPHAPEEYEELPPDIEAQLARAAAQYAPPPPPPQASPKEDAKDEAMLREQDREDERFRREQEREDVRAEAELRNSGVISDIPAAGT